MNCTACSKTLTHTNRVVVLRRKVTVGMLMSQAIGGRGGGGKKNGTVYEARDLCDECISKVIEWTKLLFPSV